MRPDTRKLLTTRLRHLLYRGGLRHARPDRPGRHRPPGPPHQLRLLALMIAMGCLPTGFLTLLLALAKLNTDRHR